MPRLLALALLLATALPALAHKDRVERAWKVSSTNTRHGGTLVSIAFKNGANARFHVGKDSRVTAVSFQSGKVKYDIPADVASRLRHVHFDSTTLGWDGRFKSPAQSRYVYLEFLMGTPADTRHGELPRVQLMFENTFLQKGKFLSAAITKKTSPNAWQSFDLIPAKKKK